MKKAGYNIKYFGGILVCAKDTTVRNAITGLEEMILIVVVYEIFPNDTDSVNYYTEEDEILVWRIMMEEEEFLEGLKTVWIIIGQEENL